MNKTLKKDQASVVRSEIGRRIKEARLNKKMSAAQISRETGFSPGRISNWERGVKSPTFESSETLAKLLDVSPNWILCIDSKLESKSDSTLNKSFFESIPILKINSKIEFDSINPEEYLPLSNRIIKKITPDNKIFAITIEDESMKKTFNKGDIVVFNKTHTAQTGDLVLAQLSGSNEIIFRQFIIEKNGYTFTPINNLWSKTFIDESKQFKILGLIANNLKIFL